jgi:hypothetical protein
MFTETSLDAQKTMAMQIRARGNTAGRLRNKTQYANNAEITLHYESEQSSIVDFRRYIVVVNQNQCQHLKLLPLPCLSIHRPHACGSFQWRDIT